LLARQLYRQARVALGTVAAPDEKSAIAGAAKEFNIPLRGETMS
jgi:hypothetical protein